MKQGKGVVLAVLLSQVLAGGPVYADFIEGTITDMNLTRKTFQLRPSETKGEMNAGGIFIVRSNTFIEGARTFRGLEPGDRVSVEARRVNPGAWKALRVVKKE